MKTKSTGYQIIKGAKQVMRARNVRLGDLLQAEDLSWVAVLTHGYLCVDGGVQEVRDFRGIGIEPAAITESGLAEFRSRGILIEGEKRLTKGLMNKFLSRTDGEVWIRLGESGNINSISIDHFSDALKEGAGNGEFEASSDSGAWYLRSRDDDALIFVAAEDELVSNMLTSYPGNVLRLSKDFIYVA